MGHSFIHVLIADDEAIVREGLKHIIDWDTLGFSICAEAANGVDALDKIRKYQPGLVLLDIKMPRMYGTELIERARNEGYRGSFIVLSGYSDFKFAQTALHFGASFYLTKPIDEEELTRAVLSVKEKIEKNQTEKTSMNQYLKKAKATILLDILKGIDCDESMNYIELGLSAPIYQVVIYEEYTPFFPCYSFASLLKITNQDNGSFEHLTIDNKDVILLKGNFSLERFNDCLRHYEIGTEKGSPLDSIFLSYGRTVSRISDIKSSYDDCVQLIERRFFCDENQHVLSFEDLPVQSETHSFINPDASSTYSNGLVNYIQTDNRRMISQMLTELKNALFDSTDTVMNSKHFLADIFLQIKQFFMRNYEYLNIPFPHNAAIIALIENKYYLYEILLYFTEQFEMIIRAIGNNSGESIFDDILYYIEHNYTSSLKLESIAPLFGYNSSYLGKLFASKAGQSFNSYLDKVRIEHSMQLLSDTNRKVYEIAAQVGYNNVDYFHQKFRKQMNMSPAEYRKIKDVTIK